MDSNQLFKYVYAKYGLKFEPIVSGSTDTYVLMSPLDSSYFAMLSRIKDKGNDNSDAVLDLKCGEFASTIRDLPGFMDPVRITSENWVGIALKHNYNDQAIKKALDYAFKLAMNDQGTNVTKSQYFYIPGEKTEEKYQAQPIKQRLPRRQVNDEIPDKIRQMRELYDYSILPSTGRQKNFYIQGQFMDDYEDKYKKYFSFKRFFPTYHDMNVGQLRSYFTWRTKIRKGKYHRASTSYVYVYLYELFNNIGVEDPQAGYERLIDFEKNYVDEFDLGIKTYLDDWLKDYVLYYELGKEKIADHFAQEIEQDHDSEILHYPQKYTAEELAEVFAKKTTYWKSSKVIVKNKPVFTQILKCVWQELLDAKKYGIAYYSSFVDKPKVVERPVFKSGVFYRKAKKPMTVKIDDVREYYYQKGWWHIHLEEAVPRQRTNLNTFLHEVDRLVREKLKLGRAIKPRFIDQAVLRAIEAGIAVYQKQKEKAKIDQIRIDFSDLDKIRANASVTRDSLLTDEEKQLEQEEQEQVKKQEQKIEVPVSEDDYGLDQDEMFLLMTLLQEKPWQDYVQKHHLMVSILADNINEKLFDEIGDSVIEFNEQDQPQIIEDYQEDLKELFLKG
ncbi:TerB N-terminal domain-containing protein [Lactobacillus helveticus]|uniref:TerB N-terminal domain-containing protein n=1 Tax=Lactobacillus helveticus TaxID=1587 RepID=UPI00324E7073